MAVGREVSYPHPPHLLSLTEKVDILVSKVLGSVHTRDAEMLWCSTELVSYALLLYDCMVSDMYMVYMQKFSSLLLPSDIMMNQSSRCPYPFFNDNKGKIGMLVKVCKKCKC